MPPKRAQPAQAAEATDFVHPAAGHAKKKKYGILHWLPKYQPSLKTASIDMSMQSPKSIWYRTNMDLLCFSFRQHAVGSFRPDSRLRRDLQLLGAHPLSQPWLRPSNLGVLSRVFNQKLALHWPTRNSWKHSQASPTDD